MIAPSARTSSACEAPAAPRPGEIHLWFSRREAVESSDAFLRGVLSRYTGAAPAQLPISRGPQGKPALAGPSLSLDFNLSGSGDWLAMAVSGGAAVGIDLEYCDPGREVMALARRFFRAPEVADLQACAPALRSDRFYEYWTLKEAHIKAAGGSLGLELETTGFALACPGAPASGGTAGTIASLAPAATSAAWYGLLQPFPGYRLALCCHDRRDFSAGLSSHALPGSGYCAARPPVLRAVSRAPAPTEVPCR